MLSTRNTEVRQNFCFQGMNNAETSKLTNIIVFGVCNNKYEKMVLS